MDNKVLVLGDILIDKSWHGDANRLCPEAPTPVINYYYDSIVLGGAANCARNIKRLGTDVDLIGRVGQDAEANAVKKLLLASNITNILVEQPDFQTSTKLRIYAGKHLITRVDFENTPELHYDLELNIKRYLKHKINNYKVVIISDYGKGFCSESLCQFVINLAKENKIFVIVDPKRYNLQKYFNASLICPNLKELCDLTNSGEEQKSVDIILRYIDNILITKSEKGASLYSKELNFKHWTTFNNDPISTIGAGDAVIAGIAHYLVKDYKLVDSIEYALKKVGEAMKNSGTIQLTKD